MNKDERKKQQLLYKIKSNNTNVTELNKRYEQVHYLAFYELKRIVAFLILTFLSITMVYCLLPIKYSIYSITIVFFYLISIVVYNFMYYKQRDTYIQNFLMAINMLNSMSLEEIRQKMKYLQSTKIFSLGTTTLFETGQLTVQNNL